MKKIIAMMCAALFLFGGTYALASTSFSEPQTFEKSKKKDKSSQATQKKTDNTKKDSSKDKNNKEGNKKDSQKSDSSKK